MRAFIAVGLVFSMYHLGFSQSVGAATIDRIPIRQQVTDYGIGAKLKLKLARGQKLSGNVAAINDEGFQLASANAPAVQVRYDEVKQVKLAQRAYHAGPDADPADARRVVLSLGAGRHAVVKFAGRELHGNIQRIGDQAFTLLPDRESKPIEIAYRNVTYVEKNLTFGATIVLVVLIVAAVVVISTVAATR